MFQRNDINKRILKLRERELGKIGPKSFSDSILSSEELIRSWGIQRKLKGHRGCVNTLCFNTDGTVLLSGSDDRKIILWNWEIGSSRFSFQTGHSDNILHAQFIPYRDDQTIVTCSADGQVRRVDLAKGVDINVLATQNGRVHKMAVEPGSPNTFYSCAEDGFVFQYDLRTNHAIQLFQCLHDTTSQIIELFSIAIDPTNPNIFSLAGSDICTYIYDIRKYNSNNPSCRVASIFAPYIMNTNSEEITGLAYSNSGELLVSYFNDNIYLFPKDYASNDHLNINNDDKMAQVKEYRGHSNRETIKGVYFLGPRCEYVCSGSDTGHAFIWRKKDGEILRALKGDKSVLNCVESHPLDSVIVTSGIEKDVKVWTPCLDENKRINDEVLLINDEVQAAVAMSNFIVGLYDGFGNYHHDDDYDDDESNDDDDMNDDDDDDDDSDDDDDDNDDDDEVQEAEG